MKDICQSFIEKDESGEQFPVEGKEIIVFSKLRNKFENFLLEKKFELVSDPDRVLSPLMIPCKFKVTEY